MFKNIFCAFLLMMAARAIKSETSIEADNLVLMLTKENFTTAIAKNDLILVNFYAPWCGHCRTLGPEYLNAALELSKNNSRIKFAKVDATIDDELAYEQEVRSYPTLKFFRNGISTPYTGGRRAEDIVEWLTKELEPPVKELKSMEEVSSFLKENPIAILGFFKHQNTQEAQIFYHVASELKEFAFGMSECDEVFAKFDATVDDIMLFKPYDERETLFDDTYSPEALKKFIQLESLPLITEFDHATASKILHGPSKSFLLFFISNETENQLLDTVEPLRDLAKTYRNHVLFVTVTYDEMDKKRAFEYFGIAKNETPTVRLITLNEKDELIKYKPETKKLTVKDIDEFLQQYLEGFLKQHFLTQSLPDDWDSQPLKTLVATNFYDVAYDPDKTVLVEFYAPWCGHCKQLEPVIIQLAEKYKEYQDVIIAKIDGVANEVENLKVTTFPTIKLFRRGDNAIVDYERARNLEGLSEFLESEGKNSYNESYEDDDNEKDEL